MPQNFHCPKCKTLWTEEGNEWAFLKVVTCPFCRSVHPVKVSFNSSGLIGEIAHVREKATKLD